MSDVTQIVAWCAAIQTAVTALVGGVIASSIRLRKAKSEIRIAEHAQDEATEREAYAEAKEAFLILIEDFRDRIKSLEESGKRREAELQRCHQEHAESRIEVEILKGRLLANDKAMELVEFKLSRLWAHDEANKKWAANVTEQLADKEAVVVQVVEKKIEPSNADNNP